MNEKEIERLRIRLTGLIADKTGLSVKVSTRLERWDLEFRCVVGGLMTSTMSHNFANPIDLDEAIELDAKLVSADALRALRPIFIK